MKSVVAVTFLSGLYFVLYFVLPEQTLQQLGIIALHPSITQAYIIVGTMAFGVGIINLFIQHLFTVIRWRKDALFSIILLLGMLGTLLFGGSDWYQQQKIERRYNVLSAYKTYFSEHKENLTEADRNALRRIGINTDSVENSVGAVTLISEALTHKTEALEAYSSASISGYAISFFNDGVFVPLGSSMFALLSFYIASAAFRAFRFRSIEAGLLMGAALFVVFGQVSIVASLWDGFPIIRNWLLTVPNTASFRGISLGASIAGLVLSIRIWLSLDRNQMGEG